MEIWDYADIQDARGRKRSGRPQGRGLDNHTVATPGPGPAGVERKLAEQMATVLGHRGVDPHQVAYELDLMPGYVHEALAILITDLLDFWRRAYAAGVIPTGDPMYLVCQHAAIMLDAIESGRNHD